MTRFEEAVDFLSDYNEPGWKPTRWQKDRLNQLFAVVPDMTPARAAEIVQAETMDDHK